MEPAEVVAAYARRTRQRLPATILPYWLRVSRDDVAGGYLLRDDVVRSPARRVARAVLHGRRPRPSDEKQLVSQTRLLWLFAHAHRHGFDPDGRYLDAAWRGRQFLLDHFRDREHGGYRWATDRFGRPVEDAKVLYGQGFVIYAYVELARASGAREPLDDALELFRVVERELHDDRFGGWREHGAADWSPLPDDSRTVGMPFVGRKSANALVHWMEATSVLYADTHDRAVERSLREALSLGRAYAFPTDPADTHEPFLPDWTPDPAGAHQVSYGHNVEYAWLRLQAQADLGDPLEWDHFHAYVDHTLANGFDHRRGGAFTVGRGDDVGERHKVFWVQCELIAALTVALTQHRDLQHDRRYEAALAQTVTFVERAMTDRRDGILFESVEEDGHRRQPRKSGDWKAGYHDVRAAVMLAEAFAPGPAPEPAPEPS